MCTFKSSCYVDSQSIRSPNVSDFVINSIACIAAGCFRYDHNICIINDHFLIVPPIESKLASREALRWRSVKKLGIETAAPRFQVDYSFKKDVGLDKEKVLLKQLNKQAKREHKAVVRELRRDADFLSQEKFKEESAAAEQRKAERNANFAWLEEQVGTMNQHVKKDKGVLTGGGSGGSKKMRIKRR